MALVIRCDYKIRTQFGSFCVLRESYLVELFEYTRMSVRRPRIEITVHVFFP